VLRGDHGGIYPVRAAGQDQQRLAVGIEDQAVGDRPDLATELSGRCCGGGCRLGQLPDLS